MRRQWIGAALALLGVLVLLFQPVRQAVDATRACPLLTICIEASAHSRWGLIHWPSGWESLFLPLLIIGSVLIVGGIVLMIKTRRVHLAA